MFVVKRVYDEPADDDGYRVLVDRLWPRGVSKEHAHLDEWLKEVAPSTELRQWFNHETPHFAEFEVRYRAELDANPAVDRLRELGREHPVVTLLIGARDPRINHGVVLADYLAG
ncbi:DUF488 domain-containing protein [Leifsonia sp. NPDC058292]|uniref:DUF488 domain-containing protein n=1 Tax=Leifsonia sp. NPDC058292 TaxID=3346428 RepID=UPI0036D86C22